MPAGQSTHATTPTELILPAAHSVQVVAGSESSSAKPATQAVHAVAPLLEYLQRDAPSWWRPWSSPHSSAEITCLLELLGARASHPDVVKAATVLCAHQDATVARAARAIVDPTTR